MLFKITHGLCDFPTKIFTSRHISRMNPCNYISSLHGLMHFSSVLSITQLLCGTHFTPNRLLGLFLSLNTLMNLLLHCSQFGLHLTVL